MSDPTGSQPIYGPTPLPSEPRLTLLVPPSLLDLGEEVRSWLTLRENPVDLVDLDRGLQTPRKYGEVAVILWSSLVPLEELETTCARVSLMHAQAKKSLRIWSLDGSSVPQEVMSLKHPRRHRALALLLGEMTLTRALSQGRQAPARSGGAFSAPELDELERSAFSAPPSMGLPQFTWSALRAKSDAIELLSRRSRLPVMIGLVGSLASLVALAGPFPRVATTLFVLAQLILGAGVIGMLWSFFEHRGLKQQVYLFWVDAHLSDPSEELE